MPHPVSPVEKTENNKYNPRQRQRAAKRTDLDVFLEDNPVAVRLVELKHALDGPRVQPRVLRVGRKVARLHRHVPIGATKRKKGRGGVG